MARVSKKLSTTSKRSSNGSRLFRGGRGSCADPGSETWRCAPWPPNAGRSRAEHPVHPPARTYPARHLSQGPHPPDRPLHRHLVARLTDLMTNDRTERHGGLTAGTTGATSHVGLRQPRRSRQAVQAGGPGSAIRQLCGLGRQPSGNHQATEPRQRNQGNERGGTQPCDHRSRGLPATCGPSHRRSGLRLRDRIQASAASPQPRSAPPPLTAPIHVGPAPASSPPPPLPGRVPRPDLHRVDIDPVQFPHDPQHREEVDRGKAMQIAAASHSAGEAYRFASGEGVWPPQVKD
jgi:hypothetical protein